MNDDRGWDKVVDAIDERYGLTNHGRTTEPLEDRTDLERHIAFIEFEKGGHAYRLERVTAPAIVDKKSHYHRAATGGTRVENVYDKDELSHKTNFYRKDGEEWELLDPSDLQL
jgi:hypothetical protein